MKAAVAMMLATGLAAAGFSAFAAQPGEPAREAPSNPAPVPEAQPTDEEIGAAVAALGDADTNRLLRDRDYATAMMRHIDRLARRGGSDAEVRLALEHLRLMALVGMGAREEGGALIDRLLARQSTDPEDYGTPWTAALVLGDNGRALAVIEAASRDVRGVGWAALRRSISRVSVGFLFGRFRTADDEASKVRLAAALFRIGYPGGDPAYTDSLRMMLLNDRLRQNDTAGAAGFAAGISTPDQVVSLIVSRRYDNVLPAGDRLDWLRRSLDARDRETSEALAASPEDVDRLHDRAQFLRAIGREADALAVLAPATRDVAATVAAHDQGMWLINQAAYALVALGRDDEAVALMRRLVVLPMAENPDLIGPSINFTTILWQAGRYAESLDHAARLERETGHISNDYGKMWIASSIACSLARLGRAGEAAAQIERLRAQRQVNPAALTRALVCLGDTDAAAAALIERLESDDPDSAILAVQDYALGGANARQEALYREAIALRERADVRAALDRVGRTLTLPLARTYWGGF